VITTGSKSQLPDNRCARELLAARQSAQPFSIVDMPGDALLAHGNRQRAGIE
jgi:hypothetical protein